MYRMKYVAGRGIVSQRKDGELQTQAIVRLGLADDDFDDTLPTMSIDIEMDRETTAKFRAALHQVDEAMDDLDKALKVDPA